MVIVCVRLHQLFRASLNPFAVVSLFVFSGLLTNNFFLLHEIKIQTAFDNHFYKEIFPVLEQNCYFLFQLL